MTVANKVLITGGAQRLGRAIALDLAAAGWDVAIQYHSSESEALALVAEIEGAGRHGAAIRADLRDFAASEALVAQAAKALGPLTALVTCASTFEPDELGSLSKEGFEIQMAVNLRAPIFLAQALARQLPKGAEGAIVNLVDQRVLKPTPKFFSYTLSKLALWQATQTLAQALAPAIRVNAVAPGPALRNPRQSEAHFKRQIDATLLKRASGPEDIAAAVRYLLSAKAVTGHMLTVDSGQHLIWQTPDVVGVQE